MYMVLFLHVPSLQLYEMIQRGLFPSRASKRARTYYTFPLLKLGSRLIEAAHVSAWAIQKVVNHKWTDRNYFPEALAQFRMHDHFAMKMFVQRWDKVPNSLDCCPACYENRLRVLIADACFKFWKTARKGDDAPPMTDLFLPDAETKLFVASHPPMSTRPSSAAGECSHHFKANGAGHKSSDNRAARAIHGACCEHGRALHFVNVEGGEKYAYTLLLLLKAIEQDFVPSGVSYDVGCRWLPYARRFENEVTNALERQASKSAGSSVDPSSSSASSSSSSSSSSSTAPPCQLQRASPP